MFLPALYKKTLLSHFLSVLPWSQPPLDYRNFLISSDCGADHKGPWHLLPVFCWWCQQTFDGDLSTKGIQGEAWSKLYLRSSVPLMLLQCRWAAVRKLVWGLCSYNVYCDYWKEIGKKKKDVSTAVQHSLPPATWVSNPCKFWGQKQFTRCPVRTRCKRGY